jgi:hypothetical protein
MLHCAPKAHVHASQMLTCTTKPNARPVVHPGNVRGRKTKKSHPSARPVALLNAVEPTWSSASASERDSFYGEAWCCPIHPSKTER